MDLSMPPKLHHHLPVETPVFWRFVYAPFHVRLVPLHLPGTLVHEYLSHLDVNR